MTRIEHEKMVVEQMVCIYCRRQRHRRPDGDDLCEDCRALLDYAHRRLDHCPMGDGKSSCRKCRIHCYSHDNRDRIRAVMRYVGPRMLLMHPFTALRHMMVELMG